MNKQTQNAMQQLAQFLDRLSARWQDEKEYEDFADYKKAAQKKVTDLGFKYLTLKRSPFQLNFSLNNVPYEMKVTKRKILLSTIA